MKSSPERDTKLEQTIVELLEHRAVGASICPSEAARSVGGEEWRDLMDAARAAAARLEAGGTVEITQGGERVEPGARGPIRIRFPR